MQIYVMQRHFGDTDALRDVTRTHGLGLAAGLDMFAGDRDLFVRNRRFYLQCRIFVSFRTTACYIPTNPSSSVATYLRICIHPSIRPLISHQSLSV